MTSMERILLVDDEPNVLQAFRRRLAASYDVALATSASQALTVFKTGQAPSVIVTDMYMPGMQGADLLKEVARLYPECSRIMLTGLADQKTAIRAINEGAVFRFLVKPCSGDALEAVVREGVEKRALFVQERDLLQNTLGGVIRLLNDLLTFVDPEGIGRANRMRQILKAIGPPLGIPTVELELAAMLQGVGRLSLPLEVLLKLSQGGTLSPLEAKTLDGAIDTSARLLREIPRFERISKILELWHHPSSASEPALLEQVALFGLAARFHDDPNSDELKGILAQDQVQKCSQEERQLLTRLQGQGEGAVATIQPEGFSIRVRELCAGHRLLSDVKDKNGKLLLRKGFTVSPAVVEKVRNHHSMIGIMEPIQVNERIPTRDG